MHTVIKTGEPLSDQLSKDIRANVSVEDYYRVGNICGVSGSYLRQLIYQQGNISDKHKKAVETLIRMAIQNSQSKLHQRQRLIDVLDECESEALQKLNEVL